MPRPRPLLGVAVIVAAGVPAGAVPSNVEPANRFSWGENVGWINFADANARDQGIFLGPAFLEGFAWGENIGFINFGDGAPANGAAYQNIPVAGALDFGVNVDPATGALSGFAWGENVGWINFTLPTLPASQQPRLDTLAAPRRLRGYAWGENIGWINLDSPEPGKYVAFVSAGGCNVADIVSIGGFPPPDGELTVDDYTSFINAFAGDELLADIVSIGGFPPADGELTVDDYTSFINAFAEGC